MYTYTNICMAAIVYSSVISYLPCAVAKYLIKNKEGYFSSQSISGDSLWQQESCDGRDRMSAGVQHTFSFTLCLPSWPNK